jgi:hypothetical protein
MAFFAVYPKFRSIKPDGTPNDGGKVFTYVTATSTLATTYTDASETSSNTNPISLDENGEADIWLDDAIVYRIVVKDSTETITYLDKNNIVGIPDLTSATISLGGTLTLGGDLNVNGYSIISSDNGDINISPGGSGSVRIKNPVLLAGNMDLNGNNIKVSDGTGIKDDSGNPFLYFSKSSSATNGFTISNAASGNTPQISATGSDTNIGIKLLGKGSNGQVQIGSLKFPLVDGAANTLLLTDGSGNMSFGGTAFLGRNYIAGFGLTCTSGFETTRVDIAAGECSDSTNGVTITLSSSITKKFDTAWGEGTNQGGFSGSRNALSAFHIFIIKHANGTVDAGFDSSLTATNLLADSGYSWYRRIGSVWADSVDTSFWRFIQLGNAIYWYTQPALCKNSVGNTSGETITAAGPTGVVFEAILNVYAASNTQVYISALSQTNDAPSTSAAPLSQLYSSSTDSATGYLRVFTDTSNGFRCRASAANTVRIAGLGYIDYRGRDG